MKESKFQLIFIKFLIISEICFFVLGISSELISTQEFWIFSNSFSILGAIELFYKEKEYTLFFLILLFGVSAPLLKMILKLLNFINHSRCKINELKLIRAEVIGLHKIGLEMVGVIIFCLNLFGLEMIGSEIVRVEKDSVRNYQVRIVRLYMIQPALLVRNSGYSRPCLPDDTY